MQAIAIAAGATPTLVCGPGNRDFVHLFNSSGVTIYLKYDGSSDVLTSANGMPILPNQSFNLDNTGSRLIYNHAIYAVHDDAAAQELRAQGI